MGGVLMEHTTVRSDLSAIYAGRAPARRPAAPAPSPPTRPAEAAAPPAARPPAPKPEPERPAPERALHLRDERFVDYLATNLQAVAPLRQERRVQRNKAILLLIVALVVGIVAWRRLF